MIVQILGFILSIIIFIGIPFFVYFISGKIEKYLINKKGLSVDNKKFIPYGEKTGIVKNEVEIFKSKNMWLRIGLTFISFPISSIIAKTVLYYVIINQ